jgi:uncharacterized protein (DUF3084 family)
MNVQPTPETDAAWACFKGYMEPLQDVQDLSRRLERERDEARIELEKYTTDSEDDALYNVRRLRKELATITAQRDRLAEVLQQCREDSVELVTERDRINAIINTFSNQ